MRNVLWSQVCEKSSGRINKKMNEWKENCFDEIDRKRWQRIKGLISETSTVPIVMIWRGPYYYYYGVKLLKKSLCWGEPQNVFDVPIRYSIERILHGSTKIWYFIFEWWKQFLTSDCSERVNVIKQNSFLKPTCNARFILLTNPWSRHIFAETSDKKLANNFFGTLPPYIRDIFYQWKYRKFKHFTSGKTPIDHFRICSSCFLQWQRTQFVQC